MLTLKEFTYSEKPRRLYQMVGKDSSRYVEGIDVSGMSDAELAQFETIVEEFHRALEPFMAKYYRRFDLSKMLASPAP